MHINDQKQAMLKLLEKLVNIDSGSYYAEGINHVGAILTDLYHELGFTKTVHSDNQIDGKTLGNHISLKHKEAKNPQILILAHLDTVFPLHESDKRPFTVKENRAYGPGVIDMKASHVQVYFALKFLTETGDSAYKNVLLLLNSDEEIGSPSSKALIRQLSKNKSCALVMEPARPNGSIVSSRRGVGKYIIEVFGVAAHSGIAPKDGANAIIELCRHLIFIDQLNDHDKGISLNIGLIEGGESVNTIADYAKATIDLRVLTSEQALFIDKEIKKITLSTFNSQCQIKVTGGMNRPPMTKTVASEKIINIIKEQATLLNIELDDIATGGGSDASFTSHEGLATVDGLGPVGGKQHTSDEYLDINSLVTRTILLIESIKSISKTSI
ncbi:M20 family metallopeptidase [Thorsellia kenyensis]|uniref:M20 family metallopeptidase n=1 Tax=Thorsellia kenyensis TaxID=1549888 RepID=A0ABV6CB25_9GAMM